MTLKLISGPKEEKQYNMYTIYHNPRCRKSRETLQLLEANNIQPEIVLYLDDTPTKEELSELLKKLGMSPMDLVRKGEAVWKENFKGKDMSDEEVISAMVSNPKLIERPIVVKGGRAVLGRPPENIKQLF